MTPEIGFEMTSIHGETKGQVFDGRRTGGPGGNVDLWPGELMRRIGKMMTRPPQAWTRI